ncbi:unnamed protein product, partial [Nesidiocoris tenuis]
MESLVGIALVLIFQIFSEALMVAFSPKRRKSSTETFSSRLRYGVAKHLLHTSASGSRFNAPLNNSQGLRILDSSEARTSLPVTQER